ncbi:MAG: metal-sensing transcriptional repressor [Salinisphaeraceae bacterium]|uniref:Metal-sensing transcriptional repressor n=2 Tax=Spectribacter TaxID=3160928 RepID=A0ABU3BXQ1_9GAMM|nr:MULTISPECIES: metal-sensing transcriptional repressor [unclassified Salinisphaera]MDT0617741.1 metal-sensing transcriptional repressor [Salinisphaera sp. P385]MDT0634095.1 metal-sensing transcriptional repressor [Salinisphaera sp. W335]
MQSSVATTTIPPELEAEWSSKKAALISRLKRVEGQLRGIQAMIDREADCEQVAQQMSAARRALDRSFYNMLSCVMERELDCANLSPDDDPKQRLQFATDLLSRYG